MVKISIIGAGGRVGSSCVRNIAEILGKNNEKDVAAKDIVAMIDIPQALNLMRGMAIDIKDAVMNDVEIFASDNRENIKNSDIIVITAGKPRGPGMTREQLLFENAEIIKSIATDIAKYSPNAKVIVVSNPMDVMSYIAYETMNKIYRKNSNDVMGMGGVLDSMRYRKFIAESFNCRIKDVSGAIVLGAHGKGMVPIESTIRINGKKIKTEEYKGRLSEAIKNTISAGKTIADFGASAYFAPGVAVAKMVNAIIKDTNEILPCSVMSNGMYGIDGLFIGLPVRLGKNGIDEISDLKISDEERNKIKEAGESLKRVLATLFSHTH